MDRKGKGSRESKVKNSVPFLSQHYKWIIVAGAVLIVAVFLGFSMTELLSHGDTVNKLPEDLSALVLQEQVASKFGGDETIIIAVCLNQETSARSIPHDIRDPRVIASVVELHERLENESSIERVNSVAPAFKDGVPSNVEGVQEALSAFFSDSELQKFINRDFSTMLIKVTPLAGIRGDMLEEVTERIQEDINSLTTPPGVSYRTTGVDPQISELIEDQFPGSLRSACIVVETKPQFASSEEIRDVRDPEVVRYVDVLAESAKLAEGVVDAQSIADVIKAGYNGQIPKTLRDVTALLDELEKDEFTKQRIYEYLSEDYAMTLVRLSIDSDADAERVVEELKEVIKIEAPPGVTVDITGDTVIEVATKEH
jgi:predicted RND superfamily exporter protein